MADTGKIKYRIPMVQAGVAVGICMLIDALQFFLDLTGVFAIAASFGGFVVEGSLMLWFMWKGISYTSGKKALSKFFTVAGTWIVEIIPIVDALPMLTIGTILIIRASRAEDKLASNSTPQAANDNQGAAQSAEAA